MASSSEDRLYATRYHDMSLPPQYAESTPASQVDIKIPDHPYVGPIERRTSILVESSAAETPFSSSDNLSTKSRGDEKSTLRNLLNRLGKGQIEEERGNGPRTIEDICSAFHLAQFGTKVSIEASYPISTHMQRQHVMRGLEQAASVKRWPGAGKPPEAWGKLTKVSS